MKPLPLAGGRGAPRIGADSRGAPRIGAAAAAASMLLAVPIVGIGCGPVGDGAGAAALVDVDAADVDDGGSPASVDGGGRTTGCAAGSASAAHREHSKVGARACVPAGRGGCSRTAREIRG